MHFSDVVVLSLAVLGAGAFQRVAADKPNVVSAVGWVTFALAFVVVLLQLLRVH